MKCYEIHAINSDRVINLHIFFYMKLNVRVCVALK